MIDSGPYNFDRVFRLAVTAGILWGLIWLLGYLSDVLIPFAVAFLMAYLLNPLVNRIQTWVGNRLAAIGLALLLVVGTAALAATIVTPMIGSEIKHMAEVIKTTATDSNYASRIQDRIGPEVVEVLHEIQQHPAVEEYLHGDDAMTLMKNALVSVFKVLSPKALGVMKGTLNLVLGLLGLSVIAMYLVFLLLDYDAVRRKWDTLIPESWRAPIVEFVTDFDTVMNRHFRAQAIVCLIIGALFAIGFSMISLPMAILFGLVVGALNMIPYLQLLAIPPALALAAISAVEHDGSVMTACVMVLVVFAVVQVIQDSVLVPRIMGDVTGLRPAMILLSLSIWGKLLGMLGLLIALPMTCLLLAYYRRRVLEPSRESPPAISP